MYIGEWLEYHYKIGVDKFYIYDNDSEDRSELMKILEPWIQKNIVEYFQFPGALSQIPVYIDAIKRLSSVFHDHVSHVIITISHDDNEFKIV